MISIDMAKCLAYSLCNLQERGRMMAEPSDEVYEGQIVGIHSRYNDLVVNPLKGKKLTNMRASGSDENVILVPAVKFALEPALEFINDDELVELPPVSNRKRQSREERRAGKEWVSTVR